MWKLPKLLQFFEEHTTVVFSTRHLYLLMKICKCNIVIYCLDRVLCWLCWILCRKDWKLPHLFKYFLHIPLFHMCMLSGYIHKGKKQMLQQILYWVDVERPELHSFLLWKGVFHVTSFHCEYFCALWHFILSELSFAPNWQDEAYQKRDSVSHLKLLQSYFLFTQVSTLSPQIPGLDIRWLFTWLESVRLQNKVER